MSKYIFEYDIMRDVLNLGNKLADDKRFENELTLQVNDNLYGYACRTEKVFRSRIADSTADRFSRYSNLTSSAVSTVNLACPKFKRWDASMANFHNTEIFLSGGYIWSESLKSVERYNIV